MDHKMRFREKLEELRFSNINNEGHYFFPEDSLLELFSEQTMKDVLRDLAIPRATVPDLAKSILKGAQKCFTILILIGHGEEISSFFQQDELQQSYPDHHLPYKEETLEDILGVNRTSLLIRKFFEKQWEVAVPVLHQHAVFRKLDRKIIMPFLSEEKAGQGSMGAVWIANVHPQCHRLPLMANHQVARKEISCEDGDSMRVFQKELDNISMLTHLQHPNMVKLYCSYIYRKRHNLIFSVAQGGSLADFLTGEGQSSGQLSGSELTFALADLASALVALHNFKSQALDQSLSGCHHDLAPRNILIHDKTFLLADFGLSTLKNPDDDSLTAFKEVRGSYVAPECQMIQDGIIRSSKASRASDIWSFGCIISEVLTFMLRGPAGVLRFRKQRRVSITSDIQWLRFHLGPEAENPNVKSWLEELQSEACAPFHTRMIDLIVQMLQLDPRKRPGSKKVHEILCCISVFNLADTVGKLLGHVPTEISQNFDHCLDQMRYAGWLFAFNQMLDTRINPVGYANSEDFSFDYKKTLEGLQETLDIFDPGPDSRSGTNPHRQSSLFRYQHARLIEALPAQYRSLAKEHLERLLLKYREPNILEALSIAITEAGNYDIGVLIAAKRLTALSKDGRLTERKHLILDSNDIHYQKSVDIHDFSIMTSVSKHVLVEWLKYQGAWADEANGQVLLRRLSEVVNLLHQHAVSRIPGALPCLGLFHDSSNRAFGVVYEPPPRTTNAVTLRWILTAGRQYQPSLGDRFNMAKEICQSIHTFHKIGWLHRNIHSSNIIFFPTDGVNQSEWAKGPRIFGFAASRESKIESITFGPADGGELSKYQHPTYLDTDARYREEFDYYSIGLLLLEIGLWSTVAALTDSKTFKDVTNKRFRDMIVERRVPQLGIAMGKRYMEATRVCLLGGFAENPDDVHSTESTRHSSFKALVIDRIPQID